LPYELFYVPRAATEEKDASGRDNYFVGCPHHCLVNYAPGKGTSQLQFARTTWNGVDIEPGTVVRDGTVKFADDSTARIQGGNAMVLGSFRTAGGYLYSIIRLFEDYGSVRVDVTVPDNLNPKSKLEVVTPAAIAGVAGTEFAVTTDVSGSRVRTEVEVTSGAVDLGGAYQARGRITAQTPLTGRTIETEGRACHRVPPGTSLSPVRGGSS
jgi:hypothetical protein